MKPPSRCLGILLMFGCGLLSAQSGGGYIITTFAGGFLGDGGQATSAVLSGIEKVITDAAGNMYIADTADHRIRRVSPSGIITTVAGTGTAGFSGENSPATEAQLRNPYGLALADGNLYIADSGNNRIRRVTPAGIITTVAGGPGTTQLSYPRGIVFDAAGNLYIADSYSGRLLRRAPSGQIQAILVGLSYPGGVALDPAGNIVVADSGHNVILRVTPTGDATVVAGTGASLSSPSDVAVDGRTGVIYIADTWNNRIQKVVRQGTESLISTEQVGGLSGPRGVWVDGDGNLFIADTGAAVVRKLDAGTLRTVAGAGRSGGDGGPATSASLYYPRNVIVDSNGNLLIADTANHKVRKVSTDGVIATMAGTGVPGVDGDGRPARSAQLSSPVGLAVDALSGDVYVGDTGNARLRKIGPSGDITTLVGLYGGGDSGDGSGPTLARVKDINAAALDKDRNIYIADTGNHRIRRIRADLSTIERIAGGSSAGAGADGVAAIQSAMNSPQGLVIGKDGWIYFSDTNNHRVRRFQPNGNVETVAGTGSAGYFGDGGAAKDARLYNPTGLALDADGNLFIADTGNHRIRSVTSGGFIRTVAGTSEAGYSGDNGAAISARLDTPTGVTVDSRGNVYIADQRNHRIRRLSTDAAAGRLAITAGNNQSGSTGARLPIPLTVRLTNLAGAPVSGVSVSFVITKGLAALSATSALTNADGVASVTVTLGGAPGEVSVVASAPGLLPVQFQLTTEGAIVTGQPRILAGGVVGAGLSVPKVGQLAPNGLYTVFGENFAQAGAGWQVGPGDLVGGAVPIRFQGVCVQVGNDFAPVIHVYPTQVSFQAPRVSAFGVVPVQVILNCGAEGQAKKSNIEYAEIRAASPEFFFFVNNADGRNPVAAVGASGTKPGDYVTIYGTGFGATSPLFFAGDLPDRAAAVTASVSVTLGGRLLAESDVLYAGVTPGFAGLYQLNIRIPADAADGDLPLVVSIGGVPSPDGAYLTVKSAP